MNQAVRWVNTKEQHASHIITTVAEYFLTQKIKAPKDKAGLPKYYETLAAHHKVMKLAMKAKQTVDAKVVADLGAAIKALETYWPKK